MLLVAVVYKRWHLVRRLRGTQGAADILRSRGSVANPPPTVSYRVSPRDPTNILGTKVLPDHLLK